MALPWIDHGCEPGALGWFMGLVGALAMAAALAACSSDTSQTAGSGSSIAPPTSTGDSLVDRLGAAAARCGYQSHSTVPGGWQVVAVGDKGCTVWVPGGWIVVGSFTSRASAFADNTGQEGIVGLAGLVQASACTPLDVTSAVLQGFASGGYGTPQIRWQETGNAPFGGSVWAVGTTVFTTSMQSAPLVGYLWLLTTPTIVTCNLTALGFWEPQTRVEADTCVLTQVLNSVHCPSGGGGCNSGECDSQCKGMGASGGICDPDCTCR